MAALLTDYTSYAEVRATLGVDEDELEDATLALHLYANLLEADLEDVDLTLPATYAATKALPTPTQVETRFLQNASTFATFSMAKQITASLPLFAARQITDSKAGVTRFDNPYRDTIKSVLAQYDLARSRLLNSFGALTSSAVVTNPRILMAVAPANYNPITGV